MIGDKSSSELPDLIPTLIGDERRIKQILMNLIRNAIKFTQFGSVSLKVHYESYLRGILTIEVSDTGAGIAQKDIPFLFTRFGKL